jgi:hypothetical protein
MELWCVLGSCAREEDGEGCMTGGVAGAGAVGEGRIMRHDIWDMG